MAQEWRGLPQRCDFGTYLTNIRQMMSEILVRRDSIYLLSGCVTLLLPSPIEAKRCLLAFRRRWYKNSSKRSIKSATIPPTIPMTVPTGTGWAEFELAWEVAVGQSVTSEVETEPSCLVVVTNCVADWHNQIVREDLGKIIYYLLALDSWEFEEVAVELRETDENGVTVGRISLASNSTRSNSKSKFPALPLLVIITVCQILPMGLDW